MGNGRWVVVCRRGEELRQQLFGDERFDGGIYDRAVSED